MKNKSKTGKVLAAVLSLALIAPSTVAVWMAVRDQYSANNIDLVEDKTVKQYEQSIKEGDSYE